MSRGSGNQARRPAAWRLLGIGALLLLVAGVAAACTPDSRPTAPDVEFVVYQGQDAVGGDTAQLSHLRGKPVVLNFWAGECPPCRAEMPDFQAVHETYRGRLVVLGLDVGPFTGLGSRAEGRALLQELGVTYPAGSPPDGQAVLDYQITAMPTTVFITAGGRIFRKWTGALNSSTLERLVEELLKA